eukprot:jgi/Hompol1/6497/HPOL_002274-RA
MDSKALHNFALTNLVGLKSHLALTPPSPSLTIPPNQNFVAEEATLADALDRIRSKEVEVTSLQTTVKVLQTHCTENTARAKQYKARAKDLATTVKELEAFNHQMESHCRHLDIRIADLCTKNEQLESDLHNAIQEKAAINTEVLHLRTCIADMHRTLEHAASTSQHAPLPAAPLEVALKPASPISPELGSTASRELNTDSRLASNTAVVVLPEQIEPEPQRPEAKSVQHYRNLPWDYIERSLAQLKVRSEILQRRIVIRTVFESAHQRACLINNPCASAIVIQAHYRGYRTRVAFHRHRTRLLVCAELIETEASYLQGLFTVIKCGLPVKTTLREESKAQLSKEDFSLILHSIERIANTSATLLFAHVQRIDIWHIDQTIGDLFQLMSPHMKVYATYIDRYRDALRYFSIQKAVTKMPPHDAQRLQDLLITPVQRLPRYLLFIKELLKNTNQSHSDWQLLCAGRDKLDDTIKWINENMWLIRKQSIQRQGRRLLFAMPLDDPIDLSAELQHTVSRDSMRTHSQDDIAGSNGPSIHPSAEVQRFLFLFSDLILGAETQASSDLSRPISFEFQWALALADITKIESKENVAADQFRMHLSWKTQSKRGTHLIPNLDIQNGRLWLLALLNGFDSVRKLDSKIKQLQSELENELKVTRGYEFFESFNIAGLVPVGGKALRRIQTRRCASQARISELTEEMEKFQSVRAHLSET